MRINEITSPPQQLTESLSRRVYHWTGLTSAFSILKGNQFILVSLDADTDGDGREKAVSWGRRGRMFFMSTTRSRQGGYHRGQAKEGVLFELDGDWFNRKGYISRPVNYYPKGRAMGFNTETEAEDRIYSKTRTIPASNANILSIHILAPADHPTSYIKKLFDQAKAMGIPAYVYDDKEAWLNHDARNRSTDSSKHDRAYDAEVERISKDPKKAYDYANYIIQGPFPAGEAAIAKDPQYAYWYAENQLNGNRFPAGEAAIASAHPAISFDYAKNIIRGPWPEAEANIAKDQEVEYEYEKFLHSLKIPYTPMRFRRHTTTTLTPATTNANNNTNNNNTV